MLSNTRIPIVIVLALVVALANLVLIQPQPVSADGPSVDGFAQDPITGVVEAPYVVNAYSLAIPRIAAPADGHRGPCAAMKTVRRPPYPKWNPGYFPCSSLTPLPLSSRRPSVSFGGFGLKGRTYRLEFINISGCEISGRAELDGNRIALTGRTNCTDPACGVD